MSQSNLLLDTCVLSEFAKKQPDTTVVRWLSAQLEDRFYISVITIGELKRGVERLPPSARREQLNQWLARDILERFDGRIVAIDTVTMLRWGGLRAHLDAIGKPMQPIDSLIAATALARGFDLATRNLNDFAHAGLQIVNPWALQS